MEGMEGDLVAKLRLWPQADLEHAMNESDQQLADLHGQKRALEEKIETLATYARTLTQEWRERLPHGHFVVTKAGKTTTVECLVLEQAGRAVQIEYTEPGQGYKHRRWLRTKKELERFAMDDYYNHVRAALRTPPENTTTNN